jgi:hypothetical protein
MTKTPSADALLSKRAILIMKGALWWCALQAERRKLEVSRKKRGLSGFGRLSHLGCYVGGTFAAEFRIIAIHVEGYRRFDLCLSIPDDNGPRGSTAASVESAPITPDRPITGSSCSEARDPDIITGVMSVPMIEGDASPHRAMGGFHPPAARSPGVPSALILNC